MAFTGCCKLECACQSNVCRCELHVSTVQSHTEKLKTVVELCIEPFDHRKRKVDNWSHFLVVACRFNKPGEVEVKLAHVEADRVMNEVLVRKIKFAWKRTHFESTFFRILVIEIGVRGTIL